MKGARAIRRWVSLAVALAGVFAGQAYGQSCPSGYPNYCSNNGGYCCASGYPYCTASGGCSSTSSNCPSGQVYCSNNGGYCCSSSYPYCTANGACSSSSSSCPSGYGYCSNNGGYCCASSTPYCTTSGACSSTPCGSGYVYCSNNGGYCCATSAPYCTASGSCSTSSGTGSGGSVYFSGSFSETLDFAAGSGTMHVDKITNATSTYTTGTLRLELWATSTPYGGGGISGYRMLTYAVGQLPPNNSYNNVNSGTVGIGSTPPAGTYYVSMLLSEYAPSSCSSADGFCLIDYGNFQSQLTAPAPAASGGGGGGGTLGGDLLLALVAGAAWRQRRSRRLQP